MNEPIYLVVVRNPFDRSIRDERALPLDDTLTIARIVDEFLPVSADLAVSIDGELITKDEWAARTLKPGEQLVVMPVLHGDNALGSILMIAVAVFAPQVALAIGPSMGLTAGSIGMSLLTAGISFVGSAIVGGLMAPSKQQLPSSAGLQSFNNSPTYSWSPATTQQPGGPVARAYGRHKLYGNIIAGYIESQGSTGQDQIAHLLIDLGSGPYSKLYDFKINDQPVGNYSGVKIIARMGHLNQDIIPAFNDTRLTHSVNSKVVLGSPVVRETVGNDYDALEILLICPQGLWYANNAGGLDSISVNVAVEISADGGATWSYVAVEPRTEVTVLPGYWSRGYMAGTGDRRRWHEIAKGSSNRADHTEGELWATVTAPRQSWHWMAVPTNIATTVYDSITLSGATQQPIRHQLRVDNLVRGTRYKIRCTNLSTDQTSSRYGDDLYLAEISEIMYDDFQYPRSVLVGVDALATNQLSGSLKFSCMAEAAIVRVWNGSAWSSAWSNNPAWVCWDILTQPVLDNNLNVNRYDGLDPSRLNLASFYAWAQFCDTQVPDGKGGTEKRCEWDGIFDTPTSLWDAALEVCASARAQLVIRGTTVVVVVDDTRATPAQLFSVGNTAVSGFNETFLPMQDRAASIEVNYLDAAQAYVRDTLTVVNTAITEAAALRTSVGLRGVTRASQAWREANFRLKRNELLKRSASIGVDIDALACTVGDLIWVQSDVTRWGVGGRAASGSTTTKLMLDQSITLDAGKTYELKLRLADDTLVTRAITTPAGTVTAVDVSVAFPSAPALYDVYAIGETSKAAKEFIVLDITRDGEQRAKLSLIEYNASLYGIDSGIPALPTPDISSHVLPEVLDLTIEEVLERAQDGTILAHLDLHFSLSNAERADIYRDGQNLGSAAKDTFRIANVTSGETYTLVLHPFDALGTSPSSTWQSITHTVIGKNAPPSNVASLTAVETGDGINLIWPEIVDMDRADYGLCVGNIWAEPITWVAGTSHHISTPAPGTYTYRIRARDTSGNLSAADTTTTQVISTTGNVIAPGAAVKDASVAVDALGNAVITFDAIADPQITGYELRSGTTFESGTKLATTAGNSFSLPVLSLTGLTLWIKGVYAVGYTAASFRIAFGTSSLNQIQGLSWRVSEPDLVFTWGAVAGASQYVALFEDGGVSRIKIVATPEVSFAIPKWASSVFRVFAIASSGGMSPYNDLNITLTGVYNYNEIVNINLPITSGQYINLAFTAANQVKRVSLLGAGPANGSTIQNINDSGLYGFGYNLQNVAASGILSTPAAWFRNNFWEEKNGFFESGVLDLGSVLSGKLLLNLSKTISYAGAGAVSGYSQVNAGYMGDNYAQEITDNKAFLSARLLVASDSPNSATWTEVQNGDWVTAVRYVKLVIEVALAGPLTDVTVTAGYITLDVPDISEQGSKTGVTSAGSAVTFTKTYSHISMVLATARGAAKAYTGNITTAGCTLYVDTGTQQVDYFVKGY